MIEQYCRGTVPHGEATEGDEADERAYADYHAYINGTRGLLLHEALDRVWETVARANEYVQRESPWLLAKDSNRRRDLSEYWPRSLPVSRQALALAPSIPAKIAAAVGPAWRAG
jgi:methionyl-tRNA synthetase